MTVGDTSIAVAAFASWHERHEDVRAHLDGSLALPAHAMVETYAVLTRLPPPHRAPTDVVADWLTGVEVLTPASPAGRRELVRRLATAGLGGGAVYDGLVAVEAREHGQELLTLDARAARTYEVLDVPFRVL